MDKSVEIHLKEMGLAYVEAGKEGIYPAKTIDRHLKDIVSIQERRISALENAVNLLNDERREQELKPL